MAWDASRPVPYRRLLTEWTIYAAIMVVVFGLFLRDAADFGGLLVGLVVSLPLWIGFSYVLAKLGYQRKTLREARAARQAKTTGPSSGGAGDGSADVPRSRPAPTKRTGGTNRPGAKRR
jgi:hypothetical protein